LSAASPPENPTPRPVSPAFGYKSCDIFNICRKQCGLIPGMCLTAIGGNMPGTKRGVKQFEKTLNYDEPANAHVLAERPAGFQRAPRGGEAPFTKWTPLPIILSAAILNRRVCDS
jgi:hypothetical protein